MKASRRTQAPYLFYDDHARTSVESPLHVHEILFRQDSGFKHIVSYRVKKTIRSNESKAESERQEDDAEEAIFKDLETVPSHQRMIVFTTLSSMLCSGKIGMNILPKSELKEASSTVPLAE